MAITSHAIDTYRIYHYSEENSYGQTAVISCFGESKHRATLYFYKTGEIHPVSTILVSGTIYLRFTEARLSEIVATLREEKPLMICFNDVTGAGWVSTSPEPVGEEEGV